MGHREAVLLIHHGTFPCFATDGFGKVIMTKDEENTIKHLLVPYEEENHGTIPNPKPGQGCGFDGLSAPDSQGRGLDPNFLNQERGAQYDGSSIPTNHSSSSSSSSSGFVLPPSSSIVSLQPMATPASRYGFDDPLSLDEMGPGASWSQSMKHKGME